MGKIRKTKHVVEFSGVDMDGKVTEITMFIPRVRWLWFKTVRNERGLLRIGPYLGRRLLSIGPLAIVKDVNSYGDTIMKRRAMVL